MSTEMIDEEDEELLPPAGPFTLEQRVEKLESDLALFSEIVSMKHEHEDHETRLSKLESLLSQGIAVLKEKLEIVPRIEKLEKENAELRKRIFTAELNSMPIGGTD